MELVTRQYERPGHQQRLLQTFTEDAFIFSLLVYIRAFWTMHSTNLVTYLLTYLLTNPDCNLIFNSDFNCNSDHTTQQPMP